MKSIKNLNYLSSKDDEDDNLTVKEIERDL